MALLLQFSFPLLWIIPRTRPAFAGTVLFFLCSLLKAPLSPLSKKKAHTIVGGTILGGLCCPNWNEFEPVEGGFAAIIQVADRLSHFLIQTRIIRFPRSDGWIQPITKRAVTCCPDWTFLEPHPRRFAAGRRIKGLIYIHLRPRLLGTVGTIC